MHAISPSVLCSQLLTSSEKAHLEQLLCSSWQVHREQQLPAVQHFLPVDPPLEYHADEFLRLGVELFSHRFQQVPVSKSIPQVSSSAHRSSPSSSDIGSIGSSQVVPASPGIGSSFTRNSSLAAPLTPVALGMEGFIDGSTQGAFEAIIPSVEAWYF